MKNEKKKSSKKIFPVFKDKKVLIFGLGLLGRGVKDAIFFAEKGANVTVTDLKTETALTSSIEKLKPYKIKFSLAGHKEQDILETDLIIRNAAVPLSSPFIALARKHRIPVDMDESLFAEYCPCPIIGVTGTRGKSTTTALIAKLLENWWANDKRRVYLAGNVQGEATLPLIDKVKRDDLVVLELSSWQLQGFGEKKISPHIAVFTNVFPDHLNYYPDMRTYINDKKNIYRYQNKDDYCVINKDNFITKKLMKEIKSKIISFSAADFPADWRATLPGRHNLENICAAIAVGKIFKISLPKIKETVCQFKGLEHRLEFVNKINQIAFINDSTSTTPIAGQAALDAITSPIILLAGGAHKNLDLSDFAKSIVAKVKAVILLEGTATNELACLIKKSNGANLIAGRFNNLEKAVRHAYSLSLPGDTILLSPGCASFGMFINEFDRGEQFKKIVNQLR
ncbi:UDP-N-acetylmuramoyl-L-alanine--D-glutamate ligase [Candidatus Falkowbacteria bacterium]|nr:UDP-N-acetylmuramoyl-L-alanine--D-glutamate ligase [Candidatus Falkowbacteria bacterium]